MIRFLERRGFYVARIRGSHHVLQKGDFATVIPVHGNDTLKIGTVRGILRDIDLSPDEFIEDWRNQ